MPKEENNFFMKTFIVMFRGDKKFPKGDMKCLWGNQMSKLNIYFYIECDFICSHRIRRKGSIMLLKILHLFIKHKTHGIFQLDYKKRWIGAWPNSSWLKCEIMKKGANCSKV
jgi:hypothetical protein